MKKETMPKYASYINNITFHPYLILCFQVLSIYAINVNEVSLTIVAVVLFIGLFVLWCTILLFNGFLKNNNITSIYMTVLIIMFFSYGRILNILMDVKINDFVLGRNKHMIILYLFMVILFFYIVKLKIIINNKRKINYYLNIFSIVVLAVSIITTVANYDWTRINQINNKNITEKNNSLDNDNSVLQNNPNVYFLIFDSYVSNYVLKKYYNYNNDDFLFKLEKQGFSIDKKAVSNYSFTGASINSTLNMDYIHKKKEYVDAYNQDTVIGKGYSENLVMKRFRTMGYKIITNKGKWKSSVFKRNESLFANDFVYLMIHITMLRIFEIELVLDRIRQKTIAELDYLKNYNKSKEPTFMYVHVEAPHSPFVFKFDGSRPKYFESNFSKYEDKEKFINQLKYVSSQIKLIVGNIKKRDPTSIIILQSDHGFGGNEDDIYLNRNSEFAKANNRNKPPVDYLKKRFGILSAISYPKGAKPPDNLTPVNLFRHIFNAFFDDEYLMLPNESYFATIKMPYVFHDVTGDIK
jgi:hypothetical protein